MYIPSWDFRIFDLPMFSPLQAQEFGAATSFSANTPTSYIDQSLNSFAALLNPNNPNPYPQRQFPASMSDFGFDTFFQSEDAVSIRDRATKVRDQAQAVLDELGGKKNDCPQGRNILGGCGPILGSKPMRSNDSSIGDDPTHSGQKIGSLKEWFDSLPSGSGIFLIAVIVIILLFLFVKR